MKYLKSLYILFKICSQVKVFNMQVKHERQGRKFKSVGTHGRVLSQGTLMRNIKVLSNTYHSKNTDKVKVFGKQVKHKCQGHKVKSVGTH
jgi:hypothetical protein